MNRRHATIISVFLALALVLGVAAVLRSSGDGAGAAPIGELAARNAQLDRYEAQLRTAANARPPALPVAAAVAAREPQRVVYVRAPQAVRPEHADHDGEERDHDGAHHDRDGQDDD
ncbi:MAG TPA: hypothetical protein VFI37_11355 [Gaiellaceae bacterium]|nr:hypothetical protein [Gaiellaceae bacterium]